MKPPRTNHPMTVLLAAIVVLGACGGDEKKADDNNSMEAVERMMKAHKERVGGDKKTKTLSDTEIVRVKLSKPGWVLLAKSFSEYMEAGYTPNIFQPHANEMIPRPRIHYRPNGVEGTAQDALSKTDTQGETKKDPLQEYIISDYKLVLTMLGTSQPKALVTDPQGRGHVLTVNPPTWVGRKRYQVKSIGRYNVELEIQGENANLNSIKPPYLGKGRPPVARISATAFIGKSDTPPRDQTTPNRPLRSKR